MNLTEFIKNALNKSFQKKLGVTKDEAIKMANNIICDVQDHTLTEKEKREDEEYDKIWNAINQLSYFIKAFELKDIDTFTLLSKSNSAEQVLENFCFICRESSKKRYIEIVKMNLDCSNISLRSNFGQFFLYPEKNATYLNKIISKAYKQGLIYWKRESPYMSEKEEAKMNENIDTIMKFYPFLRDDSEIMAIPIPKRKIE